MSFIQSITFIIKSVIIGVVAGFLILFFMPNSNLSFNWQSAQQAWAFYQQQTQIAQNDEMNTPITLENLSFSQAVQKAYPSVVKIYAYRTKNIRNTSGTSDKVVEYGVGFGSGIVLDDGYIVTNYHVIENAERISINMYNGRSGFVNLVGFDQKTDIAILHSDIPGLKAATLANSKDVLTGDIVMAIGSPFGRDQSVSLGIVSTVDHDPTAARIQTDAAINTGNSGGPLINANGEVVGINQATLSSRGGGQLGVSAAIPIDSVKRIVRDIVEYGYVRRNWMGIETSELTLQGYRRFFPNIEYGTGILVTEVEENSPALVAGIRANDLIVKLNGQNITGNSSFYKIFYDIPINGTADLEYVRNGTTNSTRVLLKEKVSMSVD